MSRMRLMYDVGTHDSMLMCMYCDNKARQVSDEVVYCYCRSSEDENESLGQSENLLVA